ncbi:MAG: hypothetical protein JWM52_258 [Candidatus Saccharibacteria bacterium]|nr:hypothetical protein [Candidatus Saccharibacteria bacterium]
MRVTPLPDGAEVGLVGHLVVTPRVGVAVELPSDEAGSEERPADPPEEGETDGGAVCVQCRADEVVDDHRHEQVPREGGDDEAGDEAGDDQEPSETVEVVPVDDHGDGDLVHRRQGRRRLNEHLRRGVRRGGRHGCRLGSRRHRWGNGGCCRLVGLVVRGDGSRGCRRRDDSDRSRGLSEHEADLPEAVAQVLVGVDLFLHDDTGVDRGVRDVLDVGRVRRGLLGEETLGLLADGVRFGLHCGTGRRLAGDLLGAHFCLPP